MITALRVEIFGVYVLRCTPIDSWASCTHSISNQL